MCLGLRLPAAASFGFERRRPHANLGCASATNIHLVFGDCCFCGGLIARTPKVNLKTTAVPGVYSDNWLVHLIGVPIPQEAGEGFEIQAHSATVDLDIDPSFLSERYFVNIWHILQESFSNIEKYANAKNVSMSLATREGDIYLVIADEGDGFDLETSELDRGYGLPNIKDRAERLGGVFYIESSPGAGTKFDIKVPLPVPPARPPLG